VKRGILILSLDFELHWGGFEKWPLTVPGRQFPVTGIGSPAPNTRHPATYNQYFLNTRKVIPQMLRLFEQYQVHVTWAGVGMLMHETKDQLIRNFPELKPTYFHQELSAYHFMAQTGIGADESEDPFHYAHSLVKQIVNTPYQELGSHTFAHFYCNEEGQTCEQFRDDLRAAQKAAARYGVRLQSLVFPRNQFNEACLRICYEEGFICVRSNPSDWFWKIDTREESKWKRLTRGVDAYFPLGNKNSYDWKSLPVREGLPLCLPASRLLRPYRPKEFFLNRFKIQRIEQEMEYAAEAGEAYHLWWHPHNFGHYPAENIEGLEALLNHYNYLKNEYGMESCSMGEVANQVLIR
jgi:peptidoglycan/xylan/chitin deacetylase (PgdA/CDA1 family)